MSLLDSAIKRAPLVATAHLSRGLLLKRLGRTRDAVHDFRAARFLDDNAWLAPYQLALCLEALGDDREAAEAYRHTLAILEANGPSGIPGSSSTLDSMAIAAAALCRRRLQRSAK